MNIILRTIADEKYTTCALKMSKHYSVKEIYVNVNGEIHYVPKLENSVLRWHLSSN